MNEREKRKIIPWDEVKERFQKGNKDDKRN